MPGDGAILPAATVVLLRESHAGPEVLLLQRNARLAFHGGAWVFPGGRVDLAAGESDDEVGARRAAAREAHEEAGLALDPDALVPLSHWTTPEGPPRRFATWFFIAEASGAEVRVDGGEIQEHRWYTAAAALAAQRAGAIELPPPTFVTLVELDRHRSVPDALAAAARARPLVYLPRFVPVGDEMASLYPGDAGWETRDPALPGPRHRLLYLASGWRYLREV